MVEILKVALTPEISKKKVSNGVHEKENDTFEEKVLEILIETDQEPSCKLLQIILYR